MRKGRQKGQTKAKSIINDVSIAPYKILIEEDQYVLLDGKDIPQGYYSSMGAIINKISRIVAKEFLNSKNKKIIKKCIICRSNKIKPANNHL